MIRQMIVMDGEVAVDDGAIQARREQLFSVVDGKAHEKSKDPKSWRSLRSYDPGPWLASESARNLKQHRRMWWIS